MKTAELEGKILDYYVALAVGHTWRCKWMLEKDGYNAWQSYENGWGNPTPPYSSDWAVGGPVIESAHIDVSLCWDYGFSNKPWYEAMISSHDWPDGKSQDQWDGPTMLVAAMRALVALHFGQDVPDVKL